MDSIEFKLKKLEKFQNLAINHALYSAKKSDLMKEKSLEFSLCVESTGPMDINNLPSVIYSSCTEKVHAQWVSDMKDVDYYDYIHFEDYYSEEVSLGNVCEHCQNVRRLKREIGVIGKRIGQIHSTMTRIGKSLLINK